MADLLELELSDLVEQAIVADLMLDAEIAAFLPRPHDYDKMKGGDDSGTEEVPYSITVTAEDRGDFGNAPAAGIKLVGVQIEVERNIAAENVKSLAAIAGRIGDRLPATQEESKSRHAAFSNNRLKVFGIMASETEKRSDIDLTRTRTIAREFVCAQIA
jgi:hypothetical protein